MTGEQRLAAWRATRVLDDDELLERLEDAAREAVAAAGADDPRAAELGRRLMVSARCRIAPAFSTAT